MIEIDNYLSSQFKDTINWASLSHAETLTKLQEFSFVNPALLFTPPGQRPAYLDEFDAANGVSVCNGIIHKPAEVETQTDSINYEPVQTEPVAVQSGSNVTHAEVISIAASAATEVIGAAMKQFEDRLNKVAASVRPQQVIAAIRINQSEPVKVKNGAHPLLPELIRLANAIRPEPRSVLLCGPGGSGKTLLATQFGEAAQLPVTIIPMSLGVSEAHLHGRFTPTGWVDGVFAEAYAKPGIICLDEFDAADRSAALSLNAPLAGESYTNPLSGKLVTRHPQCIIIATANTAARGGDAIYSARERLDGATVDRFVFMPVNYLEAVETQLCSDQSLVNDLRKLREVIQNSGASEFIGYRAFKTANSLSLAGYTRDAILSMITFPWAPDLKDAATNQLNFKAA
jgi:hypothetical protein